MHCKSWRGTTAWWASVCALLKLGTDMDPPRTGSDTAGLGRHHGGPWREVARPDYLVQLY